MILRVEQLTELTLGGSRIPVGRLRRRMTYVGQQWRL